MLSKIKRRSILILALLVSAGCQAGTSDQVTPELEIPASTSTATPTSIIIPTPTPSLTPTSVPVDVVVSVKAQDGNVVNGAVVRLAVSEEADGIIKFVNTQGEAIFANFNSDRADVSVQAYGYAPAKSSQNLLLGRNEIQIVLTSNSTGVSLESHCQPKNTYSDARHMKTILYERLEYQPKFVILGSSRAYTISPAYIEDLTGARGFNMSIQGGSFLDIYVYARYVFEHQKASPPDLLLVEFQLQTITQKNMVGDTPISLWPFIPVNDNFKPDLDFCGDEFSEEQNESFRNDLVWIFEKHGQAFHRPITYQQYRIALERQIDNLKNGALCEALPAISLEYVEKLVKLAVENNVSIVFFRPPFSKALFDTFKNEPSYITCDALANEYMKALDARYENVFYMDLSTYEPISNNLDGYYDGQHFRPETSNLMVDLLLPDILSALDWAAKH